jgi:hypothetical protein
MLNQDFKEFAALLASNRVEYLIVGGYALAACYSRRMTVPIDGLDLNFIGLEDFKTNKRASGRLQDLADLEALGDHHPDAR